MTFGMLLLALAGTVALLALLLAADTGAPPSRRWTLLRRGGLALLIVALTIGTISLVGFLFHPWAYSFIGHPTLTGGWTGRLRTPGGTGDAVFLRIYLNQAALLHERSGSGLTGEMFVCRSGGEIEDYDVSGDAENDGSMVVLSILPERAGSTIATLRGRWEPPALLLTGWLHVPAGDSTPVRAEMVKGRKAYFEEACHNPPAG